MLGVRNSMADRSDYAPSLTLAAHVCADLRKGLIPIAKVNLLPSLICYPP
jgi:hypothetical protein